jgi:hypothetical protein
MPLVTLDNDKELGRITRGSMKEWFLLKCKTKQKIVNKRKMTKGSFEGRDSSWKPTHESPGSVKKKGARKEGSRWIKGSASFFFFLSLSRQSLEGQQERKHAEALPLGWVKEFHHKR